MKTSWNSFSKLAAVLVGMALLLAAAGRTLGSGGGGCDDSSCTSFFEPEIIQSPEEAPFFLSDQTFYSSRPFPYRQEQLSDLDSLNLDEWAAYFGGSIPRSELSGILYKMPAADLKAAFAKYGNKNRTTQALEYLELAKHVEPIATRHANDNWQEKESPEHVGPADVKELIDTAEKAARKSGKFIAQRYRFQVIRLMFYSGQFAAAQQYFDQYKGAFSEENSPKYRFMGIAAGAYYKDQKYGKANYLNSIVFDRFAPLKDSAYLSFHPMEDGDWNETLALARSPHEREVLWQLLGIYADGMAAIDQIYAMDPRSKLLPLLLVREVNRAENYWTSGLVSYRNRPRSDDKSVGETRLARIKAIADAGNTGKPYLWDLAAGHLLALAGDLKTAEAYIAKSSKSMPKVPDLQGQARMSLLFARVRAISSIDRTQEPFLAGEYTWLRQYEGRGHERANNLEAWTERYLSEVYLKGGDTVRSLMLTDSEESEAYRSVAGLDAILAFMRNASSPFDRFLLQNYTYSPEHIQELRALQFLYAGDFANAVETFKFAGSAVDKDLNADPFTIHIKDCHDCDAADPHMKYTKRTFAERMLTLSRAAQGQGEAAAAASLELANGLYNMSYYGNGRDIYDNKHSNLSPLHSANLDAELALNMNLSRKYYVQAFNLSTNREFKARAAFMAAKTEQNTYYNTRKTPEDPQPQTFFKMLKDSFSATDYYREIIRECGTFKAYVGQ